MCEVASEQVGHHRAKVGMVGLLSDLGGLDGEQAQHTSLGGLGRAIPVPPTTETIKESFGFWHKL